MIGPLIRLRVSSQQHELLPLFEFLRHLTTIVNEKFAKETIHLEVKV